MNRLRSWLLCCLLIVGTLAACSGSDSDPSDKAPTALTQEQAELLATARFRNFDAGVRTLSITIPDPKAGGAGSGQQVTGWVDFVSHLGYAAADQGDTPLGSLLWSPERIAINETVTGPAVLPVPTSGWRSDKLVVQTSALTQALSIVLNLASDRPENPLLLRQSDAAFIRTDKIGDRSVIVLAGPSPATAPDTASATPAQDAPSQDVKDRVRYWIDADGLLLRVETQVAGATGTTVIDLGDAGGTTLDTKQVTRLLR